jgi:hypothetical protein
MRHSPVSSKQSEFLVVVYLSEGRSSCGDSCYCLFLPDRLAGFPGFPGFLDRLPCLRPDKTGENEQTFILPAEVEMAVQPEVVETIIS